MAEIIKLGNFAQTEVIVIPIIDVSGSMAGERIASVNDAMQEVPSQLHDINEDTMEAKLKIAPMEFSSGARWFALQKDEKGNDVPADVETFRWIDRKANGLTDLGAVCDLLNEKLTVTEKGGWMKGRGGAAPVIILISDGGPTDEYQKSLARLKQRGWFRAALKFAVAIDDGADKDVLAEFTGNLESVIDTTTIRNDLASIVKTVVVSASKTASQNSSSSNSMQNVNTVQDSDGTVINAQNQEEANKNVHTQLTIDQDLF